MKAMVGGDRPTATALSHCNITHNMGGKIFLDKSSNLSGLCSRLWDNLQHFSINNLKCTNSLLNCVSLGCYKGLLRVQGTHNLYKHILS